MKRISRSHVHVDRVAIPWLITRFSDSEAELLFVSSLGRQVPGKSQQANRLRGMTGQRRKIASTTERSRGSSPTFS